MFRRLLLITLILFIASCKSIQKVDQTSNNETMFTPKITAEDLEKSTPIIIKTEKGERTMYSVIIYTDDAKSLKKDGIIVQSESKGFVTALISKDDLQKLNQNSSVKAVSLPQIDYPTNDQIIN